MDPVGMRMEWNEDSVHHTAVHNPETNNWLVDGQAPMSWLQLLYAVSEIDETSFTFIHDGSSRQLKRMEKVLHHAEAGIGEDGEGARPTSPVAFVRALELLTLLSDELLCTVSLWPVEEGGILLEWANAERVISVEIEADGSLDLLVVRRDEEALHHHLERRGDLSEIITLLENHL